MLHEHIELFERTFVKQHGQAFAGRVFAFLMLGVDSFLAAAEAGFLSALNKFFDVVLLDAHIEIDLFLIRLKTL